MCNSRDSDYGDCTAADIFNAVEDIIGASDGAIGAVGDLFGVTDHILIDILGAIDASSVTEDNSGVTEYIPTEDISGAN